MHSAGFWITTNHGMTPPADFKSLLDLESRQAFTPRRICHLPNPNRGRPQFTFAHDRLRIGPLIRIRPSRHDREVFFFNLTPFKNDSKLPRSESVLSHQDKSARVAVQAVHDRRPGSVLHFKSQKPLNSTEQGRLGLAIRRVHNQRSRLVDHKPVGRFVDHRKIRHNLQAHPAKSHQPIEPRNLFLFDATFSQKNTRDPPWRISGI